MTKAEIQLIRSLDDKRGRTETGLFVAEGEKLVREILASHFRVRKIYYTEDDRAGSPPVEAWQPQADGMVHTEQVSPKEMERASRLKTPTDCLALVEIPRRSFDAAALRGHLTLALDEVQNPGNMGTIIRLADWFGITDIVCSEGSADCFNPKVVQATMGAITRVAVHYGDLAAMIGAARTTPPFGHPYTGGEAALPALPVYGTFLEGENIYGAELTTDGIIVLGSEGRGISAGVEQLVSRKLLIPSYPLNRSTDHPVRFASTIDAAEQCSAPSARLFASLEKATPPPQEGNYPLAPESLNVAIAAAIVCSEFRRR